jgi:phosphate uptake regulator
MEFLWISKEQITVVKSALYSLISTFLAISYKERNLSKELEDMAKHINKQDREIKKECLRLHP